MTSAPIETALELWASSLRDVKARIRPLFTQARVAASAGQFLGGLLGPERRKTGWMRAEAAGDPGPWRQQAILGRGRWDAEALRDIVRDYALETLADPDAVLVTDETGFLKQGKTSCGVGRQYTGSAGKITNCQIGVFAAYVSRHGHALIDRALYLPKDWTSRPERLAAAHVPAEIGFATKPQLAGRLIEQAIAAGVPFAWVAADSVYGVGALEMQLRRAGKGYVLGVNADSQFNSWIGKPVVTGSAEEIAQSLEPAAWKRLSAGEGTKGPRLSDWAYLELADLDADECKRGATGIWTRGLLIRRSLADGECAYFTTWCPAGTTIETLVAVEGQRWAVEDAFETAKTELGLDHNETRSWHRAAQQRMRKLIWDFYADLRVYRLHPSQSRRRAPRARFDRLFRHRTGFVTLDRLLARLHANKAELLMVLERPDIPLHTNGSENDIRCQVIRRKISAGTRSEAGRECRDAFLGLAKTCAKQAIAFWDYLGSRLNLAGQALVPYLPDLIRCRGQPA